MPDEKSAQVDAIFSHFGAGTPGCAVAVDLQGEMVHAAGYGMADLEQSTPITTDSAFYAASVSKQIVAMAMALLAYDNKLDLDAPVGRYLPELAEYIQLLSVRQFIHHTSGLRDYFTLHALAGRLNNVVITEDMVIDLLKRQHSTNFPPGSQYQYSNSGYFLLSLVAKSIDGRNLHDFASERIFKPLNMTATRFQHNHRDLVPHKTHGYANQTDGSYRLSDSLLNVVGSGGAYTTVTDLIRWSRNFANNTLGGGAATLDMMEASGVLNSGETTHYGFGLRLSEYRGQDVISHTGGLAGYRNILLRFPQQNFSIAILCNTGDAEHRAYANAIADIYLANILGEEAVSAKPEAAADKASTVALPKATRARFAGAYYSDEVDNILELSLTEGGLLVGGADTTSDVDGITLSDEGIAESSDSYFRILPLNEHHYINKERRMSIVFEGAPGSVPTRFTLAMPGVSEMVFSRLSDE
ncbi:MAG: serine hydrolase domain-containing protein [Pseudomonadota bacterium]